jgi:hypothetical protein
METKKNNWFGGVRNIVSKMLNSYTQKQHFQNTIKILYIV